MLLFALMSMPAPVLAEDNPLLKPWTGPPGGVPPFDVTKPELFGPALEKSTSQYKADIKAIAENSEAPTCTSFQKKQVSRQRLTPHINRPKQILPQYYTLG